MTPEDNCATCKHSRAMHVPKCSRWFCGCPAFDERIDPTPPDGRGWDDGDNSGNPGDL